jgi:GntR family transcriptional regulator
LSAIETSKTHRLYLLLKEQIATGALAAGERLPSEPQLAAQHSISRVTVRRALDGLARDGVIRKLPGSGSFVAKPPDAPTVTGDLTDMLAHLAAMGRTSRVRLLAFSYVDAPPAVADALRLPRNARVQHALRVRLAGDTPFSYLTTYVPEDIGRRYSRRDLSRTALLELLERSGVTADRAEQTITASLAGPDAARALAIEIGAPLLALTRVVFDASGRGVEYLSARYRPDMHCIRMELSRAGRGADRYWMALRPQRSAKTPAKTTSKQKRSSVPGRRNAA